MYTLKLIGAAVHRDWVGSFNKYQYAGYECHETNDEAADGNPTKRIDTKEN